MNKHEITQRLFLSSVPAFSLAILLGLAVGLVSMVLIAPFENREVTYLLVGLLGLMVFGPIALRILQHSLDLAEPGIWLALFYFTHFGARAIYDTIFGSEILGFGPETNNFELINAALSVSIIGLLAFWIGYYTRLGKAIAHSTPTLPRRWSGIRAFLFALICLFVGWGLRIYLMISQAGGIRAWLRVNKYVELTQAQGTMYISIISGLATVGLLIIFVLAKISRNRGYWLSFYLFLLPELIFRFFSGSRSQFIFLLLGLLIGSYMISKRGYKVSMRYIRWVVVLVVLLITLYPLFSIIRGGIENIGVLSRTSKFWEKPTVLFKLIEGRQIGLDSLAVVMKRTSEGKPYTLGSELSLVLIAWIPRKLWSDKPTISIGKIFYNKFFPPIYNKGTAVAITFPGEFYWDLGFTGVIIGMLFTGVMWRFFFEYLIRPKGNLSNILVVSVMFPMFFVAVEQTLVSLLTMHLFQFIVVVSVVILISRKRKNIKIGEPV